VQLRVAGLGGSQAGLRRRQFRLAGSGLYVGQVLLCRSQAGLRRSHLRRVSRLLQRAQLGLGAGQGQLGLLDSSFQVGGIQGHQQVAGGHLVAHLDGDLTDVALHLQHNRALAAELDVAGCADLVGFAGGSNGGCADIRPLCQGCAIGLPAYQAGDIDLQEVASARQHDDSD
jgi:hypothetical protein